MKKCPQCGRIYKDTDSYCLNDNQRLLFYAEEQAHQAQRQNLQDIQSHNNLHLPKCPTCQSTDITKVSATSKAIGAFAFGLFSTTARSQFKCNNCGYKW